MGHLFSTESDGNKIRTSCVRFCIGVEGWMTTASELEAVSDRIEHMDHVLCDESITNSRRKHHRFPSLLLLLRFLLVSVPKLLSVCLFGLFCVKATNCHFVVPLSPCVPRLAEVGLVDDLESFWV